MLALSTVLSPFLRKEGVVKLGTREIVRAGFAVPNALPPTIREKVSGAVSHSSSLLHSDRRSERRLAEQRICQYEICTSIDENGAIIEQGEGYSLNRSAHGILLLIGCFPRVGQIVELRMAESRWSRSVSLYAVQWTKSLSVDSCGRLCLSGCHLVFGPSRYWAV